ncbi:MAG: VWA domain-containing protein [Fimbriiglobus sp.]
MAQLTQPVEPFGEVNVHKQADGSIEIVATVLMVPDVEGARTGLALDASASMKKLYGVSGVLGGPFAKAAATPNLVEPVAQTMANYLAQFSSTGTCDLIYWAVNPAGDAVEPIGQVAVGAAATTTIAGPKKLPWGRGTKLLPPVRYFVETAFATAPWAICVFVTDGVIEDINDVKTYCTQFAKQIASGQRKFIKFVLLGIGEEVDETQMEELDDMFEGSGIKDPAGEDIDLWDHKLVAEMRKVEEIFAEVVSADAIVLASARIVDQAGNMCKDFPDGMPAMLRFKMPKGSTAFTIDFPGGSVTQDITEGLTR